MITNLQLYLSTGLIKSTFVNLKIRKLSAETCHEFIDWCGFIDGNAHSDKLKTDVVIYKQDLYVDFIQDNPDFAPKAKMTISRNTFYKWLNSYGVFVSGIQPIEGRDMNGRWIKFIAKPEPKKDEPQLLF